jgi:hypothetical protein
VLIRGKEVVAVLLTELFPILFAAQGPHIDSELLGLLVQMTTLEAKSFRSKGDIVLAALEFRDNRFAFKRLDAVR